MKQSKCYGIIRGALLVVAVLGLVVPASFAADGDRDLAVFVMPKKRGKGKAVAVMLGSIVRERASEMSGVQLYTGSPVGSPAKRAQVESLSNAGFKALNTGGDGLESFGKANDLLKDNPDVGGARMHARVAKGLGVSHVIAGDKTEGQKWIKRSLLLYSQQSARQYAYTVDAHDVYQRAQREITDMAKGSIAVQSIPSGAEVLLNGVFKGYTPITLQSVPAGHHFIELRSDGYKRWINSPVLQEGATLSLDASLDEWDLRGDLKKSLSNVRRNMSEGKFAKSAKGLAVLTGAKEVLVLMASSRGGNYKLAGFHWNGATVTAVQSDLSQGLDESVRVMLGQALGVEYKADSRVASLETPPPEKIKSVMEKTGVLDGESTVDPDSPLFDLSKKSEEDSVLDKWWFWTAIGGGVALTVTAVVLAVVLKDDEGPGAVGNLDIQINRF